MGCESRSRRARICSLGIPARVGVEDVGELAGMLHSGAKERKEDLVAARSKWVFMNSGTSTTGW